MTNLVVIINTSVKYILHHCILFMNVRNKTHWGIAVIEAESHDFFMHIEEFIH